MGNIKVLKIIEADIYASCMILKLFSENENINHIVKIVHPMNIHELCCILNMKSILSARIAKKSKVIQEKIIGKVCLVEFEDNCPIKILDRKNRENFCPVEKVETML